MALTRISSPALILTRPQVWATKLITSVEHLAPHCTSDECFKGVLDGSGKAVFNGQVRVALDAQLTWIKAQQGGNGSYHTAGLWAALLCLLLLSSKLSQFFDLYRNGPVNGNLLCHIP